MNDSSFLILFIALTALMAVVPFLLRKYHIPNVIALLVVGMLIGSNGLLGFDLIAVLSKWLSFLGTPGEEAQTAANTACSFFASSIPFISGISTSRKATSTVWSAAY